MSAFAQQAGQIVGIVRDSSGAVVPGATVTATEVGTGFARATTTGSDGQYVLPTMRPARYEISTEASGFRTFRASDVELLANQSLTVNVALEVGAVTEVVNVAGAAAQVDTSTSTLSEVVESSRIVELPLNGRDAARLTTLVSGTILISVDPEAGQSIPGGLRLSSNGAQNGQISYRLDGASNTDFFFQQNQSFPFPDALQEFSIQTSNYGAAHGGNAGAAVNVVTRSGTNQFHGGAFEFVRNRAFNARNFFAQEPDFLKRNQFGAFGGGPVVLPGYNGHNKTFFFAGWQGTRLINDQRGLNAFAPTVDQAAGNFATCGTPCNRAIRDPQNGQNFLNNQIPVSRFDPASVNLTKLFPLGTGTGLIFFDRPTRYNFDQGVLKVDHLISPKDRLSGRFFIDHFQNAGGYVPGNLLTYRNGLTNSARVRSQSSVLNYTHTFGPTLLNDFNFSMNRVHSYRFPPSGAPRVTDLGVKLKQQGVLPTIEEITVSGFFGIGDSPEAKFVRTGFEWQDRLSYVRGRHSLSMGGSVSRKRADTVNEFQRSGRFVFNGNVTGVAMADFFLGKLGTFNQQTGEFKNFRITHWALFFQDDFKVNRRLTVNLGLRYEPSPPWHDTQNRFERFRIQDFVSGVHSQVFRNAPVGETFFGDPGVPQDGSLADNNNVAPRVGFALDVFGDGKTSLRGGVGLFYDQQLNGNFNNSGVNSTPFSTRISLVEPQGPFSDPYQGRVDPFPAPQPNIDSPFPRPVALNTFEERFTTPLTYNWNLTVERQIASAWMARVAYVGSRVNYGRRNVQLNPARFVPGASTTANTDSRRLFAPEYAPITLFTGSANSTYHSLQASLNKRLARGFTVLANYTFSKSLDNFGASVMPWYFPNGQSMDWGPSTFDHSQRFVLSWVWELPSLRSTNVLAKLFINGWQATGVGQYQTGDPLTIVSGRDNSLTGLSQDRAVFTGLDPGRPAGADRVLQWFNPAAFGQNPSTTFGTVGKGRFRGPSLYSWDMGFFKSFRLKENVGLQFRGELFNIFNQVNLADPSAQVSSGGFGRITSTLAGQGDPRIIQFGLKFAF